MATHKKVCEKVYQIGDSDMSGPGDCSIYLVDVGNSESVMIDCGAGASFDQLIKNIQSIGLKPEGISALVLTHCHIDHIGSAHLFKERLGCQIIAHKGDAAAIEGRESKSTAAAWYGVNYVPVFIDKVITSESEKARYGEVMLNFIHTPGHTPGSISVYCDIGGTRVLFGQDIHGPFDPSFGSDIAAWKRSMGKLLELEADILCEGHFGIYRPKNKVKDYIEGYLSKY
jgi:glyoxylase-like metal-dependent hydrolase (beta-lactamase superfamily II)